MKSLQQEVDSKGLTFFSVESVERAKGIADSVGEIEMAELAMEYAGFVFSYIDAKAPKTKLGEVVRKAKANANAVTRTAALVASVPEYLLSIQLADKTLSMGPIKAHKNKELVLSDIFSLLRAHASRALVGSDLREVEECLRNLGWNSSLVVVVVEVVLVLVWSGGRRGGGRGEGWGKG